MKSAGGFVLFWLEALAVKCHALKTVGDIGFHLRGLGLEYWTQNCEVEEMLDDVVDDLLAGIGVWVRLIYAWGDLYFIIFLCIF